MVKKYSIDSGSIPSAAATNMPAPGSWRVGDEYGFNANIIYDANGNGVCLVFDLPQHTTVSEVICENDNEGGRYTDALYKACLIADAPRMRRALDVLVMTAESMFEKDITDRDLKDLRNAVAMAKGVTSE